MAETKAVQVPELGENIEKAEVTQILVEPGQNVQVDQPLIEVESDKAAVEIPSPFAGKVASIKVKAGSTVKIGEVIVELETEAQSNGNSSDSGDSADGATSNESDSKSTASSTAAASETKQSETAGAPRSEQTRQVLDKYDNRRVAGSPVEAPEIGDPAPAAPSVRRLARELGVDINQVSGSGPHERISEEDVKAYVKQTMQSGGGAGRMPAQALPDFTRWGPVRREGLSGIRKRIGERMAYAWSEIPHVTQFDQADVTAAEEFRKQNGRAVEKAGGKLTLTAILIKLTAEALRRFPQFNSSLDVEKNEVIFKEYVHIGVAVDTDNGLLVPVIRDADQKSITELAVEVGDLAGRARERKTKPDELQGGNFSITNLGGLGTTHFTPIINWPDVAILGVGRASTQAIYMDGRFEPRQIMPLSISYDHRVIDGADAARFLRWICAALENPLSMLL